MTTMKYYRFGLRPDSSFVMELFAAGAHKVVEEKLSRSEIVSSQLK
jgi:hypothetical protein